MVMLHQILLSLTIAAIIILIWRSAVPLPFLESVFPEYLKAVHHLELYALHVHLCFVVTSK